MPKIQHLVVLITHDYNKLCHNYVANQKKQPIKRLNLMKKDKLSEIVKKILQNCEKYIIIISNKNDCGKRGGQKNSS